MSASVLLCHNRSDCELIIFTYPGLMCVKWLKDREHTKIHF